MKARRFVHTMVITLGALIARTTLAQGPAHVEPEPAPKPKTVPLTAPQDPDPAGPASAQVSAAPAVATPPSHNGAGPSTGDTKAAEKHWYEKIKLRGYSQLRFNRLYASNDNLKNDFGDKSLSAGSGFFIRRARLIIQGDVHHHVFVYLQPDFASAFSGDALNFGQIRDWYADVAVDHAKTFRFRAGQSKVPWGWENMQSSQNRITLDRSDATNTGAPGERDIGVFAYYAPENTRRLFKMLVDSGLKGSGDYGLLAFGVYNGQGLNLKDSNTNKHMVAHVHVPLEVGSQIIEFGAGGYFGNYKIKRADLGANKPVFTREPGGQDDNMLDARANAFFVLYPRPIGFQAEGVYGVGPRLNGNIVEDKKPLYGGHAMLFAKFDTDSAGSFVPFAKYQYYDGSRKSEVNALGSKMSELEAGLEWQIWAVELTTAYSYMDRELGGKREKGSFLRFQLQANY